MSKMGNCQAPAVNCIKYKKIAFNAISALRFDLQVLKDYPDCPPSVDQVMIIFEDIVNLIKRNEFPEVRKTIEVMKDEIMLISKFDPGDVFGRTIAKGIHSRINAFRQNLIDNLIIACKNRPHPEKLHKQCSKCDHVSFEVEDEDSDFEEQARKYYEKVIKKKRNGPCLAKRKDWHLMSVDEIEANGGTLCCNDTAVLTPDQGIWRRVLPGVPKKDVGRVSRKTKLRQTGNETYTLSDEEDLSRVSRSVATNTSNVKIYRNNVEIRPSTSNEPTMAELVDLIEQESDEEINEDDYTAKDEAAQPYYDSDGNAHY
uniref:Uncharacterized protein n=1 Tax=Picornavirales sp. TaxID=1955153 RepID=A0A6M3YNV3_9VIRU|nr:MAG: hypothetical protein 3 [Picornavirales sp.]